MLKKLTIAFDIDTELFARMLMHAPSVRFEAYGTEAPKGDPLALPRAKVPLALPPPTPRRGKRDRLNGGAAKVILDQLLGSATPLRPNQLRPRILEAGYAPGTVSTACESLKRRGLARRLKTGYVATNRALEAHVNGKA